MYRIIRIASVIIALCLIFTGCIRSTQTKDTSATTEQETTQNTTVQTTIPNLTDKELEKIILKEIPVDNGDWAVYYKNLNTDEYVSINNKKMVSASLIKLFIMGMIYDEIDAGNLQDTDEIEDLMEKMITISHNDSSNRLVEIAGRDDFKEGMKIVNAYAAKINCLDTEQQRNMLDSRPVPIPEQNYTSVEDCGKFLEMIYNKQCVTPEYDEKMLNYLLSQQRRWKIPAGIPEKVKIANKTGELRDTENDVAIVFTDKADYILCVISNDLTSTGDAQKSIQDISRAVYNYIVS